MLGSACRLTPCSADLEEVVDQQGDSVRLFLAGVQDGQRALVHVWQHYMSRGARSAKAYLTLSGRPFTVHEAGTPIQYDGCLALGVLVEAQDERRYDIGVTILWDATQWLLETEASVENEAGGQELVQQLPPRRAKDVTGCISELTAALTDLTRLNGIL
jgi:hypothetical protein